MGVVRILNIAGLSMSFVGTFLLAVEALRVSRVLHAASAVEAFAKLMTSSKHSKPLPLRRGFAISLAAMCLAIWTVAVFVPLARLFILLTFTPVVYISAYAVNRFLVWSTRSSPEGVAAVIGFALVTLGFALQLASAVAT